jgi:hypothetical protein
MSGEELQAAAGISETTPDHMGIRTLRELGDMAASVGMRLSEVVGMF